MSKREWIDSGRLEFRFVCPSERSVYYPADRIPKGVALFQDGMDLSEEGIGFGVPVAKRAFETLFPGEAKIVIDEGDPCRIVVQYEMNLVERLSSKGGNVLGGPFLNGARETLAAVHRKVPFTRKTILTISKMVRARFGIRTVFERVGSAGSISVEYTIDKDEGALRVKADAAEFDQAGIREVIFMNEAGAEFFDHYSDSEGAELEGNKIETWREVSAEVARFSRGAGGNFFSLGRAEGARLFRGREVVPKRLSWAGLAFVLPGTARDFDYTVRTGRGK